jgi:ectoine hydroxylase-related dioxygenase (phytanoyl-CoA dioxygenase family)
MVTQPLLEKGFCIVDGVLDAAVVRDVRHRLVAAAEESRRRGVGTFMPVLDPNDRNVRVFNLLDLDPIFIELIQHPRAIALVRELLGDGFLISNFTANIALPGSRSMNLHSDQAIVIPEPWLAPWAINIIWCLDDVSEANGATRYVPGSHRVTRHAELPSDALQRSRPFEAKAGSIIAMDGRMWHTSGENTTAHDERALLFGYYSTDFIRPQVNWNVVLSETTRASLSQPMFDWLGLGPAANTSRATLVNRLANPSVGLSGTRD